MATTPSTMLALGKPAPDFELPDTVSGETVRLSDVATKRGVLVMFICNHCPYVQHIRDGLAQLGRDYADQNVAIIAISANDPTAYPDDAPEKMKAEAERYGYTFPYLFDESQEVAKAFTAACTPDFFLFDHDRTLVYRGQFDASRPGNGFPVTGADLRAALDQVLADQPVAGDQTPSIGCSIKWRAGNEPAHFSG